MSSTRDFMIFDTSETGSIDFNDVAETSVDTLRLNVSVSRAFVKWDGDIPTSVSSLTTKEGPYTHQQILTILTGSEWADDLELP